MTAEATSLGAVVARVEAELAAFWSTPDASAPGEPQPKMRAVTLTYVRLASARGDDVELARDELDRVAHTHPGRSLLLAIDARSAPWHLEAETHAACRLGGEGTPICHDRVEITFGVAAAARAASIVSALALPEVPVVLDARASTNEGLVSALVPLATRVVVDTRVLSLGAAAALAKGRGASVVDAAFYATEPVRAAAARALDALWTLESATGDAPAEHPVRRIARVRAATSAPAAGPAEGRVARLTAGWLASRLGFELAGEAGATGPELALTRPHGAPVPFGITHGRDAAEPAATLASLEIELTDGHGVTATRGATGGIDVTVRGVREQRYVIPARRYPRQSWVERALDARGGDAVYLGALELAAR